MLKNLKNEFQNFKIIENNPKSYNVESYIDYKDRVGKPLTIGPLSYPLEEKYPRE
jgi:hypothetical protein